jgi:hypothetical protein
MAKKPKTAPLVDETPPTEEQGSGAPVFALGDIVIYTPPQAAQDSLRSARGIVSKDWAAMIIYVRDDGMYQVRVFRPFGLSDEAVPSVKWDPDGAPGTIRARD